MGITPSDARSDRVRFYAVGRRAGMISRDVQRGIVGQFLGALYSPRSLATFTGHIHGHPLLAPATGIVGKGRRIAARMPRRCSWPLTSRKGQFADRIRTSGTLDAICHKAMASDRVNGSDVPPGGVGLCAFFGAGARRL
jgi:hypothetical protein